MVPYVFHYLQHHLLTGIPLDYKYLALFGAASAAALIVCMSLMPDTARYLLMKHQREKALRILTWLRGGQIDVDSECREIEDGLDNQVRDH